MKVRIQKLEKSNNDKFKINPKKIKISLKERFRKYNGENIAKNFAWDSPKGKEIW